MDHLQTSEDYLLGGRVKILQPLQGFRASLDSILLARAAAHLLQELPAPEALDVGYGTGAAGLCTATLVPHLKLTGLEVQPEIAALAETNIGLNKLSDRVHLIMGDLFSRPVSLRNRSFDLVMTNPPYRLARRGTAPMNASTTTATTIADFQTLTLWLKMCAQRVRPGGHLVAILPAEYVTELGNIFGKSFGGFVIRPYQPMAQRPAHRIIIEARRGSKAQTVLMSGQVIHNADGSYSTWAQQLLGPGEVIEVR